MLRPSLNNTLQLSEHHPSKQMASFVAHLSNAVDGSGLARQLSYHHETLQPARILAALQPPCTVYYVVSFGPKIISWHANLSSMQHWAAQRRISANFTQVTSCTAALSCYSMPVTFSLNLLLLVCMSGSRCCALCVSKLPL